MSLNKFIYHVQVLPLLPSPLLPPPLLPLPLLPPLRHPWSLEKSAPYFSPPPPSCSGQGGRASARRQGPWTWTEQGQEEGCPKKDWSLDAAVEEDVIEWLKGNSYLWMRSKKAYKQKRAAWEMKAQELGISVEHLEQWWKGVKDWYVKISKKTSGQATKMLTERETWVLQHCGFYKGQYI